MISGSRINYSGLRLLIQVTLPILDVSFSTFHSMLPL